MPHLSRGGATVRFDGKISKTHIFLCWECSCSIPCWLRTRISPKQVKVKRKIAYTCKVKTKNEMVVLVVQFNFNLFKNSIYINKCRPDFHTRGANQPVLAPSPTPLPDILPFLPSPCYARNAKKLFLVFARPTHGPLPLMKCGARA